MTSNKSVAFVSLYSVKFQGSLDSEYKKTCHFEYFSTNIYIASFVILFIYMCQSVSPPKFKRQSFFLSLVQWSFFLSFPTSMFLLLELSKK